MTDIASQNIARYLQDQRDKKFNTHFVICKGCGEKSVLRSKDPKEDDNVCWNHMCNNGGSK